MNKEVWPKSLQIQKRLHTNFVLFSIIYYFCYIFILFPLPPWLIYHKWVIITYIQYVCIYVCFTLEWRGVENSHQHLYYSRREKNSRAVVVYFLFDCKNKFLQIDAKKYVKHGKKTGQIAQTVCQSRL